MSRYSQLYIDQSAPLPDSARARHRLGKQIESLMGQGETGRLVQFLERELGVVMGARYAYELPPFLRGAPFATFST